MTAAEPSRQAETEARNRAAERGSRTAELVAAARANHYAHGQRPLVLEDPFAFHLAGPRWQRILTSRLLRWLVTKVVLRRVMPTTTFVLIRGRFTDDRVAAAARRGVRQLVILGAGFDTVALRFPDLPIRVFEVDLAASQAIKQERMAAAAIARPERLHLVSADFEREDFGERLIAAGFDPTRPAFFTWMGVTFYLTRGAIGATLARIGELAVPGSELVFDYLTVRERVPTAALPLFDRTLRFVKKHGEPMISSFDPRTVAEETGLAGSWDVEAHDLPAADPQRWLGERTDLPPIAPLYRLLHLRKR